MDMFFVGIVFEQEIAKKIDRIRGEIEAKFGIKRARKNPPHITLIPPFKSETAYMKERCSQSLKCQKFRVQLSGFDFFKKNRVAFIKVLFDQELINLRHTVCQTLRQRNICRNKRFHPHITLASRDVSNQKFAMIKAFLSYKEIEEDVFIDKVTIFKHDGAQWCVFSEMELLTPEKK